MSQSPKRSLTADQSAKIAKLKEDLRATLDEAEWAWVARHAERDAVIVVGSDLDILEVGACIALDDTDSVAAWISAEKLAKPTQLQLDTWNAAPDRRFQSLVVQPYVLVQERAH